jgi:hypothetical protein
MKIWFFLTLFGAATCGVLAAQDVQTVVPSDVNCVANQPVYNDWYQQTRLSDGEPYIAPSKRKQRILDNYHGLKLQMPLDEVERLLGKPDFGTARPPLHLATAPEPADRGCANDLAYIMRKNNGNMVDTEDVAVYLSFSRDGRLYWATPQNLPTLKPLGSPDGKAPTTIKSQTEWKEYVFGDDGFAVTLPDSPKPHSDATLPEFTVYSVSLPGNAMLSLRVSHQERDCAATLAQLRDSALKGKSGIDPSSVKNPSIDGNQGLEYEYTLSRDGGSSDRFYCVNGRFYAFSMRWLGTQAPPPSVGHVVASFRLLNTGHAGGPQ